MQIDNLQNNFKTYFLKKKKKKTIKILSAIFLTQQAEQ